MTTQNERETPPVIKLQAVNAHSSLVADNARLTKVNEALLEAAKNARNVLAGLVMGHLEKVTEKSPALQALRDAIALAEGKEEVR